MTDSLDLEPLRAAYRSGALRPAALLARVLERIAARGDDKVWIHLLPRAELERRAAELERRGPAGLPLYGVPFAIKDNIDLAGCPTTAACPEFAYTPRASAPAVQRLLDAGAIALGKTNLDQFATGLVGTRSPYGACRNAFDPRYVSGGSSPGSAIAVAAGGTDVLYEAGPGEVVAHLLAGAEVGASAPVTWSHGADTYRIAANRIQYVVGRDGPANQGRLCVKGRYGFDYAHHPQRLTRPLIRKEGSYPKGPLSKVVEEGDGRRKPGGLVDYASIPHQRMLIDLATPPRPLDR